MVSWVDCTIKAIWEQNFWLDRHPTRTQALGEFIETEATHAAQDGVAAKNQGL
jgi:hypothetical protein